MLRHSKTTQALISSLSKLQDSKKEITDKLKENIIKNNQIYQHHSFSSKRHNQKNIVNREKQIQMLENKLNHKIKNDDLNKVKLESFQREIVRKRMEVEKKIQQINSRNIQRIRQMKEIEEKVIKKIQNNILKNQIKERHLRSKYIRIKNEEKKVGQTKIYQRKQTVEHWRLLQAQKQRIQGLIRQHEQKQNVLVTQKNPIPIKRQQKKKKDQKCIPTQKLQSKLKSPAKVNSKQMGNQYLEQVKMMHREHLRNKSKNKLMNLNLKVINYNSDMMERIFRNTSDLSHFNQVKKEEQYLILEEPYKIIEDTCLSPSLPIKFQFRPSEDLETQRYMRQIKNSLQEFQKINNCKINPQVAQQVPFADKPQVKSLITISNI